METKVCSRCGETKEFCEFQKNKYSRDGHRNEISKDILNDYHKNYREKNRDKQKKGKDNFPF